MGNWFPLGRVWLETENRRNNGAEGIPATMASKNTIAGGQKRCSQVGDPTVPRGIWDVGQSFNHYMRNFSWSGWQVVTRCSLLIVSGGIEKQKHGKLHFYVAASPLTCNRQHLEGSLGSAVEVQRISATTSFCSLGTTSTQSSVKCHLLFPTMRGTAPIVLWYDEEKQTVTLTKMIFETWLHDFEKQNWRQIQCKRAVHQRWPCKVLHILQSNFPSSKQSLVNKVSDLALSSLCLCWWCWNNDPLTCFQWTTFPADRSKQVSVGTNCLTQIAAEQIHKTHLALRWNIHVILMLLPHCFIKVQVNRLVNLMTFHLFHWELISFFTPINLYAALI